MARGPSGPLADWETMSQQQIDLIQKDVQDQYARENFTRIADFINEQILFQGQFKLFDVRIPSATENYIIGHGLDFIPVDIITLYVEGDFSWYFKYQATDRTNIYVSAAGPVRIRFLAGKLSDKAGQSSQGKFNLIPPSGLANEVNQVAERITIEADSSFTISENASFRIYNGITSSGIFGMIVNKNVLINSDSSMSIQSNSSVQVVGA